MLIVTCCMIEVCAIIDALYLDICIIDRYVRVFSYLRVLCFYCGSAMCQDSSSIINKTAEKATHLLYSTAHSFFSDAN